MHLFVLLASRKWFEVGCTFACHTHDVQIDVPPNQSLKSVFSCSLHLIATFLTSFGHAVLFHVQVTPTTWVQWFFLLSDRWCLVRLHFCDPVVRTAQVLMFSLRDVHQYTFGWRAVHNRDNNFVIPIYKWSVWRKRTPSRAIGCEELILTQSVAGIPNVDIT